MYVYHDQFIDVEEKILNIHFLNITKGYIQKNSLPSSPTHFTKID